MDTPFTQLDFILLIPYYNNKEGLSRSLASIHYPVEKYEVLIIDDGSQLTLEVNDLQSFVAKGMKIKIERFEQNKGIAVALNYGLDLLAERNDFSYIARLDCGDECAAERFYQQIDFFQNHPETSLVGSWCRFKNYHSNQSYVYKAKTTHQEIADEMTYRCSFIHPTVILRRKIIADGFRYPYQYPHAEDYAFFFEILNNYITSIIPHELVITEQSATGISSQKRKEQLQSRKLIIQHYVENPFQRIRGMVWLWILSVSPYYFITFFKNRF